MNRFKRAAIKVLSIPDIDVKKNYKIFRKLLTALNPSLPPIYNVWSETFMVGKRAIPVRVFRPKENEIPGILLFFHGGGWVLGNIDSYTGVCAHMAKMTRQMVISVDYRLAPEHPFPAGIEDCYAVARDLFHSEDLAHCDPSEITLIGDSAGGNLAAVLSLMARDRGEFSPARQILIYPVTHWDHGEMSPYPSVHENGTEYLLTSKRIGDYMDLYVPDKADRAQPYVAPILSKDLSRQPETLIVTAEYDPLRDEGEAYGAALKEWGTAVSVHRIPSALHGFLTLSKRSEPVTKLYQIIDQFLQGEQNGNGDVSESQ